MRCYENVEEIDFHKQPLRRQGVSLPLEGLNFMLLERLLTRKLSMRKLMTNLTIVVLLTAASHALAGPYSGAMGDPANSYDPGIPGFVGPDGDGKCGNSGLNNYVNPIFVGWATGHQNYYRSDGETGYSDPAKALGAVTGDNADVVSLGDLTQTQIDNGDPVGKITLTFAKAITNGTGADFAVFENGFVSQTTGEVSAELGYVEVSTDGANWARFASDSLTAELVGAYGTVDPTNVCNLAGKHVNAYGDSWGTPFDLENLTDHAKVLNGSVDLSEINYVRIVDIPGSGDFLDADDDPIYDAWHTWGSGGVDLEAVGVINEVPEPATMCILVAGGLGVLFRRR